MKTGKLVDILKKGNFVVPLYLFQLKDNFNVSLEEFIFLIYLSNLGNKVLFDVSRFSEDLNIKVPEILSYIEDLTDKKYITVDVIKNDKNIMEEYVILDLFYDKLTGMVVDDINNDNDASSESKSNIFELIEKEFAKPLTPVEYEIINAWLESGIKEELIKEAVKEAVFSGVANLRYIDKILYEWSKKGIHSKSDVENNRKNFKEKQEQKEKLELFDYDWFEDGEDE